ncbi:BspA family leucine-rich repeat surface protein [Companilactobacillus furfuricola]|uniref:BspA family leucine-rich repeat surface protein n=1 Tax=Companilactobacillus furfuricola TaxID=1462575 RepID=UPI000F7A2F81|nr:BspA family leucine-rich repeat surface protein [Companilactobacillus furfuricola]
MKKKRLKNKHHNKIAKKGKIVAIAGLTLTAGMFLSDVTPAVATTTETSPAGKTGNRNSSAGATITGQTGQNSSGPITGSDSGSGSGSNSTTISQGNGATKPTDPNVEKSGTYWVLYTTGELKFIHDATLNDVNLTTDNGIKDKVTTITFDAKITCNSNSTNLFQNYTKLTTINNLQNLDTSKVTDFSYFFSLDSNLRNVDLSKIDTSNATNMSHMFSETNISDWKNLDSLKTEKVTDFTSMFEDVKANVLDLSSIRFNNKPQISSFLNNTSYTGLVVSKETPIQLLNITNNPSLVWFEYQDQDSTNVHHVYTADQFSKLTQDKIPFEKTYYTPENANQARVSKTINVEATKDGKSIDSVLGKVSGFVTQDVNVSDLPTYPGYYLESPVTAHIDSHTNITKILKANYKSKIGDKNITLKGAFGEKAASIKGLQLDPDNKISVPLPNEINGYRKVTKDSIIKIPVENDGSVQKTINLDATNYQKILTDLTAKIVLPDGTTASAPVKDAIPGERVDVQLPDVDGYVRKKTVTTGVVLPDRSVKLDEDISALYSRTKIPTNTSITYHSKYNHDQIIKNIDGYYNSIVKIPADPIPGYDLEKGNEKISVKINQKGNLSIVGEPIYTPQTIDDMVSIPIHKDGKDSDLNLHVSVPFGETTKIYLDHPDGYTLEKNYLYVEPKVIDGKIKIVPTDENSRINYITKSDTNNKLSVNVLLGTKKVSKTIDATASGNKSSEVPVPKIPGYETTQQNISVKLGDDGKVELADPNTIVSYLPITKDATINFTPKGVTNSKPINVPVHVAFDHPQTIDVPNVPGYYTDIDHITASLTIDSAKGETINYDKELKDIQYNPNFLNNHSTILNTNLNQTVSQSVDSITFGHPISIDVPKISGYHTDTKSVQVRLTENGKIVQTDSNQKIMYDRDKVDPKNSIRIHLADADYNFDNINGTLGSTVTLNAPVIPGYDLVDPKAEIEIHIEDNGKLSKKSIPQYTPKLFKGAVTVNITKDKKSSTVTIPVKMHYKDSKITVDLPIINEYTPGQATVGVSVNAFGDFTPDNKEPINYNLNSYTNNVTIPTSQSDKTIKNVTLHYGESKLIDVPSIDGYTPNQQQVAVHLDENNKVALLNPDPNAKIIYSPIKNPESKIKLTLKFGDKTQDYTIYRPLEFNNPVEIEVPQFNGYTTKTKSVFVSLGEKGAVKYSGSTTIEYTPIPTPAPSASSEDSGSNIHQNNHKKPSIITQIKNTVRNIIHRVTTLFHHHEHGIKLYNADFQVEATRSLSAGSDWYSDQEVVHDGKTYYRVSKNEYVAAEDIYAYENKNVTVIIKADSNKPLVNSQGKISNRMLAKNTAWHSDRTIQINGKTYYRVSTDEFVTADDVIVK